MKHTVMVDSADERLRDTIIEQLQRAHKVYIDNVIGQVEARSKRSSYPWSAGGGYTAKDNFNEGMIACALEILQILKTTAPEAGAK